MRSIKFISEIHIIANNIIIDENKSQFRDRK